MNDLDTIILSHAGNEWRKVARIAARTLDERGVAPTDDQVGAVVARVRDLVARGRLEAKGDLNRPQIQRGAIALRRKPLSRAGSLVAPQTQSLVKIRDERRP